MLGSAETEEKLAQRAKELGAQRRSTGLPGEELCSFHGVMPGVHAAFIFVRRAVGGEGVGCLEPLVCWKAECRDLETAATDATKGKRAGRCPVYCATFKHLSVLLVQHEHSPCR